MKIITFFFFFSFSLSFCIYIFSSFRCCEEVELQTEHDIDAAIEEHRGVGRGRTKGTNLQGPKDVEESMKISCNNNFQIIGALRDCLCTGPRISCYAPEGTPQTCSRNYWGLWAPSNGVCESSVNFILSIRQNMFPIDRYLFYFIYILVLCS